MTDQALVELAFTMLEKSYVPYSHFPAGFTPAAILKIPPTAPPSAPSAPPW